MRRTTCGGCGSTDLHSFLDLGRSPLANSFPKNVNEEPRTYPLVLVICRDCVLVQLFDVVPDEELFGGDYAFYSSTSPALVRYHERQAHELLATYGEFARRLTVEIGSNDGDLLHHIAATGVPCVGVDPASGPATVARERGLDIIVESFGTRTAERVVSERGHAGLVIANNVAAHVANLGDFLAGVEALLAPDGVAVIEVQYLGDLLLGNFFDYVYHEHRYFFSVTSASAAVRRTGLNIIDVRPTDQQGGSVRLTLARRHPGATYGWPDERWAVDDASYDCMQRRAERVREKLHDLLDDEAHAGRAVTGWGAPAKAVTLLNFCEIGTDRLTHVVDNSPSKWDRYIPGTGVTVTAPHLAPDADTYLVLAHNYLGSFIRQERSHVDAGRGVIVPLPNPVRM